MVLQPTPISSSRFTWIASEKTFATEASDIEALFGMRNFYGCLGRVYDDACGVGLTIISERTGRTMVFALEKEERNGEGELLYWELLPANLRERKTGIKIHVFND